MTDIVGLKKAYGLHDLARSSERIIGEAARRRALVARTVKTHVPYLDDALGGLLPHDLVLLGAATGAGKTELARQIAHEAVKGGKRVVYFALEAEPDEIERRIKYAELSKRAFRDLSRIQLVRLGYRAWYRGEVDDLVAAYEDEVEAQLARDLGNLQTYYRGSSFTVEDVRRLLPAVQDQADLIMLDHLHYIDAPGPNENVGYKEVLKAIRDVALDCGVPVLLVAHLRKKDRGAPAPVPDIDDFHGTSDIAKIATIAVTLSPAPREDDAEPFEFPTYVKIHKDRMSGAPRYAALTLFNAVTRGYEDAYRLVYLEQEKSRWSARPLPEKHLPHFYRQAQLRWGEAKLPHVPTDRGDVF